MRYKSTLTRAIAVALCALIVACASSATAPDSPITTFALVSIDSRPLPARVGEVVRLRSSLILHESGGYSLSGADSIPATAEVVPNRESGLWHDDRGTLVLSRDRGGEIAAQRVGGSVSFALDGHAYLFRVQ